MGFIGEGATAAYLRDKGLEEGGTFWVERGKLFRSNGGGEIINIFNQGQANVGVLKAEAANYVGLSYLLSHTEDSSSSNAPPRKIPGVVGVLVAVEPSPAGAGGVYILTNSQLPPGESVEIACAYLTTAAPSLVGQVVHVHNVNQFPDGTVRATSGFKVQRIDPDRASERSQFARHQLRWFQTEGAAAVAAIQQARVETAEEVEVPDEGPDTGYAVGFVPPADLF